MEPLYLLAESTEIPLAIEIGINTVFLRRDISEESRTDINGNVVKYWIYREAKMSIAEFNDYANIINTNNVIKLLNGQENADTNQLTIMQAIADMYDAIASATN